MRGGRLIPEVGRIMAMAGLVAGLIAAPPAQAKPAHAVKFAVKYAAIVIDADSGAVYHAVDADQQTYPASLTKMMTLYLTFEALEQHRIQLEHRIPVSEHAASMEPTKLGLRPGEAIRLEQAILAVVTKSANDAAVVIAEGLGGSEDNFARLMTAKAQQLGMSRTHFENASGLPNPNQISTARDMAILGRALIHDFPQYYPYFSTRSFVYAGHIQASHNHLLDSYEGADGIKTGFIRASGFNLVASAKRAGRRLIGVVFGGQTQGWRDRQMAHLLDQGFARPPGGETLLANVNDPSLDDTVGPAGKLTQVALDGTPIDADEVTPPIRTKRKQMVRGAALVLTPLGPDPKNGTSALSAKMLPSAKEPVAGSWLVQVGAFSAQSQAAAAGQAAIKNANLYQGQVSVSPFPHGRSKLYRARVAGLAENQAREACKTLSRQHMSCVVVGPGGSVTH